MNKLWVAALALCATVAFTITSPAVHANGAEQHCVIVTGASDARNQELSRFRAQKRLTRNIADYLAGAPAGATVGPTTINCILRACEATATICFH
jgi:hypothetical protein